MIRDWSAKRLRWHVHHTLTSASWLNQVERSFVLLTDKALRRSSHRSMTELEARARRMSPLSTSEAVNLPARIEVIIRYFKAHAIFFARPACMLVRSDLNGVQGRARRI